jgi:hypothetical protein
MGVSYSTRDYCGFSTICSKRVFQIRRAIVWYCTGLEKKHLSWYRACSNFFEGCIAKDGVQAQDACYKWCRSHKSAQR